MIQKIYLWLKKELKYNYPYTKASFYDYVEYEDIIFKIKN